MRRLVASALTTPFLFLITNNAIVACASSCSTITASVSPSQVDMAGSVDRVGCEVTVSWVASGSTTQQTTTEVMDVFIVLDESESVGEDNYNLMTTFVKNFIEELDHSAGLFSAGGRVGITEFSWNPTNMMEFTKEKNCEDAYGGPGTCFGQPSDVNDEFYYIPLHKYAEPNSYQIVTDLADAIEAIDSECFEPSIACHAGTADDPLWRAYKGTCLGDAIWYTAHAAAIAKNDQTRASPPARQVMLVVTDGNSNAGQYTPLEAATKAREFGVDVYAIGVGSGVMIDQQHQIGGAANEGGDNSNEDEYVLDLADFTKLDDSFAGEIMHRIANPCATNVEIVGTLAAAVGAPMRLTCDGGGQICEADGSTVIWSIADLDTTTHEMSYSIDMCDCSHIGVAVETLESTSYADDTTSPDVFPLMPKSLAVEVVDSSELCGPPSIALVASGTWTDCGDTNGLADIGEIITCTYTVTNDGTQTLSGFHVIDDRPGRERQPCDDTGNLPPGGSLSCVLRFEISQDDINAGEATCLGTVTAGSANGGTVSECAEAAVHLKTEASIAIETTAEYLPAGGKGSDSIVGDVIVYTLNIENDGTFTLLAVTPWASKVDEISCEPDVRSGESLNSGATATCKGTYFVTQADINAGKVINVANITATEPSGDSVFRQTRHTQPLVQDSKISIELSSAHAVVSADGKARSGDVITFTASVFNMGNTCLKNVKVGELLLCNEFDCGRIPEDFCPAQMTITCSGSYTLTQKNVDATYISNTATVTALPPAAGDQCAISANDSATVWWALHPGLLVEASVSLVSDAVLPYAGDSLTFCFRVWNDGTASLTRLNLTVPLLEKPGIPVVCTPSITDDLVLAPEDVVVCSASLELTQDDVDAGKISSSVVARATAKNFETVLAAEDYVEQDLEQKAGLSVAVVGVFLDENKDGVSEAGETMAYTATFQNTGNVRVGNVTIAHSLEQAALLCDEGFQEATSCNKLELLPGDEFECTAKYTLSQDDVDSGEREDQVSISGVARDMNSTELESEDSWTQELLQQALITVSLTGAFVDNGSANGEVDIEDKMEYTVVVGNSGSVRLTSVVVTVSFLEEDTQFCPHDTLAPAQSMECTASYVITTVDIDSYQVEATAKATAVGPLGQGLTAEDSYLQRLDAEPSLSLTKAGVHVDEQFEVGDNSPTESDGNHLANAGEYNSYQIVVRNTGMLTVQNIDVGETLDGAEVTCPSQQLKMSETMVCNATYLITQADLDRGGVENLATVAGYGPAKPDGEDRSTTEAEAISWVTLPQDASILVEEECTWQDGAEGDGSPDPGESMLVTHTVSNTGSVTFYSGVLREGDDVGDVIECRGDESSLDFLPPGEKVVCTSFITISQADIDAGSAKSTAIVTAFSPLGVMKGNEGVCSWTWGTLPPQIDMTLTGEFVDRNGDAVATVGDIVAFNLTVVNDGKVTVTINDLVGKLAVSASSGSGSTGGVVTVECDPSVPSLPSLAPGEVLNCGATYVVEQDDANRGEAELEFEVVATNPAGTGTTFSFAITETLPAKVDVSLTLRKSDAMSSDVDGDGKFSAGDVIAFTLLVNNTGSVDLTSVEVQSADLEGLLCQQFVPAAADLRRLDWAETNTDQDIFPPGEVYTCAGSYILKQDDVDSGKLYNTASVASRGRDPDATLAVAVAEETLVLEAYPSLLVALVGTLGDSDMDNFADVSEPILYEITIVNTGNVRMADVQVDTLLQDVTCADSQALLDPRATFSCSGLYILTQEDVDHGVVKNEVTVKATDPSSLQYSSSDVDVLSLPRKLELDLQKSSSYVEGTDNLDTVDYFFKVTNVGTATVSNIRLEDAALAGSIECPTDTLVPGASMACNSSESSQVTTKDLTVGSIVNTASVMGQGPRNDDPTITDSDTVTTLTPSAGDNPVVLSFTLVAVVSEEISRRRLDAGEKPCGIKAIVTACNQAFSVTTCECVDHSDGGCDTSATSEESDTETIRAIDETEGVRYQVAPLAGVEPISDATPPPEELVAEVDVDGRMLQETAEKVTTKLEIKFTTSVENTGAMKAAAAFDSFANVTHGFTVLLIGDCFEDVAITAVSISQAGTPISSRVSNPYLSSLSYRDDILENAEIVPSAVGLVTGGARAFLWIVVFMLITSLSTCVCACLCLQFAGGRGGSVGTEQGTGRNEAGDKVQRVDGSLLDTPRGQDRNKGNRTYSPRAAGAGARGGRGKSSAARKRARRNMRKLDMFDSPRKDSSDEYELVSSESESGSSRVGEEDDGVIAVTTRNPMFRDFEHAPRLSGLDFGSSFDEAEEMRERPAESWRWRRRRDGGRI